MTDKQATPTRGEILIVDDQPNNLRVLSSMLTEQGYDIRPVISGPMALKSVQMRIPDIILLDINMPEMNGYEVCQQLKADERTRDIPVLFISVLDEVMDKVKAFDVGGVDYVTKPFQVEEVLARVNTHLTIQRTKQALQESESALKQSNEDLVRINTAYERFVPHDIIEVLQKDHITKVQLGDQIQTDMTIMFASIRSGTNVKETMQAQETFNFINSYLGRACPVIRHHTGFIAAYIGETVMALFPHSPDNAITAAHTMVEEIVQYNILCAEDGNPPINLSIGIHTGPLMLGIIGEPQRMQTTTIANTVTFAAHIERLSRSYGASIVLSSHTYAYLSNPESYPVRQLDSICINNETEPLPALELLVGDYDETIPLKQQTKALFEEAVTLYHAHDVTEASMRFNTILQQNPSDTATQAYIERIRQAPIGDSLPTQGIVEILTKE